MDRSGFSKGRYKPLIFGSIPNLRGLTDTQYLKVSHLNTIIAPFNVLVTASALLGLSPERCRDFGSEIQHPAAEGESGIAASSAERSTPEAV